MTLPPLRGLARTLLLTLRARAEEHTRPGGLISDPQAAAWIANFEWPADYDEVYTPGLQTGFAVRARIFDDAVRRFLDQHTDPLVVELGAGLSSRPDRIGAERARWWMVDLPEVVALRTALDADSARVQNCPASLFDSEWLDLLPPADPRQVLLIAEGLLLFLDPMEVHAWLRRIRARMPGARFLFDIASPEFARRQNGRFRAAEAPIRWTVQDLAELDALGLSVLHHWPTLSSFPARWGTLLPDPLPDSLARSALLVEARIRPVTER